MDGVVLRAGEGEALFGGRIVIKADFGQLCITESLFERAQPGASPHFHRQHADSFYVLDGEAEFLLGDETLRLGAGSFVAAPIGVVHTFSNPGPGRARLLNVHAPSRGFHDRLRKNSIGLYAPRWVNQQLRSSSRKTTAFSPDCSTTSK